MNMTKKITLTIAALAALSLSACHNMPPCEDSAAAPNPTKPKVSIVDGGYIVVDQEPMIFGPRQVNVEITWQLPREGGYRFPRDGITFSDGKERTNLPGSSDGEITRCHTSENGLQFTCLNRHSKEGTYKYTINVEKDGKRLKPLDPGIHNMKPAT
jgi:hypothetical protein